MNCRRVVSLGLLAVALASVGLVSAPAFAATRVVPTVAAKLSAKDLPFVDVIGEGAAEKVDPARTEDYERAAAMGVKLAKPLDDGAFDRVVSELESKFPADYVWSALALDSDASSFDASITLVNPPDEHILSELVQQPLRVRIYFGAPVSLDSYSTLEDALLRSLGGLYPSSGHGSATVDQETFDIRVAYANEPDGGVDANRVISQAALSLGIDAFPSKVEFVQNSGLNEAKLTEPVRGGAALNMNPNRDCCRFG